jgi:hypothetical protein
MHATKIPTGLMCQCLLPLPGPATQAKQKLQVMPGAHELCEMLDRAGVPRGLITRWGLRCCSHIHLWPPIPQMVTNMPGISNDGHDNIHSV